MPMKEKTTQFSIKSQQEVSHTSIPQPSKKTLDFIRQFARAYQVLPQLNPALGGIVAN